MGVNLFCLPGAGELGGRGHEGGSAHEGRDSEESSGLLLALLCVMVDED